MGLFTDKLFPNPIKKTLVSLSSWSNSDGQNTQVNGKGNLIGDSDKNLNMEHDYDSQTPPSPSPPSPIFPPLPELPASSSSSSQPYSNSSIEELFSSAKTSTPKKNQSLSSSLSSPSDFIHINSNGTIVKSSLDCVNCTSKYNYKMHSSARIKSVKRYPFKDDKETDYRQKALKSVLSELQKSLALARSEAYVNHDKIENHDDRNMCTITGINLNGITSNVNNPNESIKRDERIKNHSCGNIVKNLSLNTVMSSSRKNGFLNRSKNIKNSGQSGNDDDESGSANMQQLSTSWEFIKLEERPILDAISRISDEGRDEEQQDVAPPRFIKISDGKISLGPPTNSDNNKEKEILERRVLELESALQRVQEQLQQNQCGSPTLEKDLKEQLESMNRTIKSKERKALQACRDHKALQARFARQEAILQTLQHENKQLQQRVRQYEHCLDDVMRKVVDALVNEDSLREEVSMLKTRVKDLEAQNAALTASPAKGKDEGYCTMSSGQPQPSNSHLEDLPEEPEQWLLAAEPCSAEMEDWSMSQDELGVITLDDDCNEHEHCQQHDHEHDHEPQHEHEHDHDQEHEHEHDHENEPDHEHDWIWNSSYLNSTMIDSQSEGITQLLQETIVYSDDEELTCTDFTRDFYKLVNIPSGSTRSLYSHMDAETDDEDDDEEDEEEETVENNINDEIESGKNNNNLSNASNNNSDKKLKNKSTKNKKSGPSPTPSEAARAFVTSCSSSESESLPMPTSNSFIQELNELDNKEKTTCQTIQITPNNLANRNNILRSEVQSSHIPLPAIRLKDFAMPSTSYSGWRKSNGWKRIATSSPKKEEQPTIKQPSPTKRSKIPPPVPVRRSYAS